MRCMPRAAMSQYKPSCHGVNIDFNILWKNEIVQVRTVYYIPISYTFSRFSLLFACFFFAKTLLSIANLQFCNRFQQNNDCRTDRRSFKSLAIICQSKIYLGKVRCLFPRSLSIKTFEEKVMCSFPKCHAIKFFGG